jgi:hypothetical protein
MGKTSVNKLDEIDMQEFNYLNSLNPEDLRMKLTYEAMTTGDFSSITRNLELILNNLNAENMLKKGFDNYSFGKGNLILYKLDPVHPEQKRICFFFKKNKENYEFLI